MKRFRWWLVFGLLIASFTTHPVRAENLVFAGGAQFRYMCGIWGPWNSQYGQEREVLCFVDILVGAAVVPPPETPYVSWLVTQYTDGYGTTVQREGTATYTDAFMHPLGESAELHGTVEGCDVEMALETLEPDPQKRNILEPGLTSDPVAVAVVHLAASMAKGTGKVCDDELAQGPVDSAIMYSFEVAGVYFDSDQIDDLIQSQLQRLRDYGLPIP